MEKPVKWSVSFPEIGCPVIGNTHRVPPESAEVGMPGCQVRYKKIHQVVVQISQ